MSKFLIYTDGVVLDTRDLMAIEVPDDVNEHQAAVLLEEMEPTKAQLQEVGTAGFTIKAYRVREVVLNE